MKLSTISWTKLILGTDQQGRASWTCWADLETRLNSQTDRIWTDGRKYTTEFESESEKQKCEAFSAVAASLILVSQQSTKISCSSKYQLQFVLYSKLNEDTKESLSVNWFQRIKSSLQKPKKWRNHGWRGCLFSLFSDSSPPWRSWPYFGLGGYHCQHHHQ